MQCFHLTHTTLGWSKFSVVSPILGPDKNKSLNQKVYLMTNIDYFRLSKDKLSPTGLVPRRNRAYQS